MPPSRQRLAGYLTKVSAGLVSANVSEVRMVEQVVEFKSKLKIEPFRDVRILVDGHVRLHELRIAELVHLLVTVSTRCGRSELSG